MLPNTEAKIINIKNLDPEIIRIIVNYIDFNIITYSDIKCEEFDSISSTKKIYIRDRNKLIEIRNRINLLKLVDSVVFHGVNTRAKATIFYNDSTKSSICLDKFNLEIQGKTYQNDNTLRKLLGLKTYKIYK